MTQQSDEQETYNSDAEFRSEELHLASVVGSIDEKIQRGDDMGPFMAGTPTAADIARRMHDEQQRKAQSVRNRPYFGRIDYFRNEDGPHTVYIGEVNLNSQNPRYFIASRNAPIAELYYNPAGGSYKEPSGRVSASVDLKRMLTIDEARLLDIEDVLRLAPGATERKSIPSRVLDEKLAGTSELYLADIVQTIQPDQYKQIAATDRPVLIVQGAAGSGKSLVALHRIDFMLSGFSDIGNLNRPTPERTIMFGPSPAFLRYVSTLLPGIGVERVRQMTLTSWLEAQLPRGLTHSRRDRIFEDLMNNRRRLRASEVDAHHFKTGLQMKRLLDNYVNRLRRTIMADVHKSKGISIPGSPDLHLNGAELKSRVDAAFALHRPPNRARRNMLEGLSEQWARSHSRSGVAHNEALAEGRRRVGRALESLWPQFDVGTEYMGILQSPARILEFSRRGDVDATGAEEISRTAPQGAGRALGLTDLPAVLYLHYSLDDLESQGFEHVVVDEAQDVSPLEMELLKMHSVNDYFTILGDLRQGILPYKSIRNWNQLASIFDKGKESRIDSRLSYRSTRQITQYANRILQGLPSRTRMPEAYERNGARPQLTPSKSAAGMRIAIADSIRRLSGISNVRSIAVLTKWHKTAQDIASALVDEGILGVNLLSADGTIDTDVTVSPIVLTKGLEFDAVIVANARKDNFFDTELDHMLFYLACTRARHHLEVHWYGTKSPVVQDTSRLAQLRPGD